MMVSSCCFSSKKRANYVLPDRRMQGLYGAVPQVHEDVQESVDGLPASVQGVPQLPHGEVGYNCILTLDRC